MAAKQDGGISANLVWGDEDGQSQGQPQPQPNDSLTPKRLTSISSKAKQTRRRSSQISQFRTSISQEEREYYVPLRNFVNVLAAESRSRFGVIRLATYICYVATWIVVMMLDDSNVFGFQCGETDQCQPRSRIEFNAMNQYVRSRLFHEAFNPEEPSADIEDIETPQDLQLWVENVFIPEIWNDDDSVDATKNRVFALDPLLIKFAVREDRQQCQDHQDLLLGPGPCTGDFLHAPFGPEEDPDRYKPTKDEGKALYPGLYAMLAWRDSFFDKADKEVRADGEIVYTVPEYDTTLTSFYSLSGVRIFNVTTPQQARDFFSNAKEDGMLTELSQYITFWTPFYSRNADMATVVRTVFLNNAGGGTSICWDSWSCADFGTVVWSRNLQVYSFKFFADYSKVFFEFIFLVFTLIQIGKEILQVRRARYTQGSTKMYFFGSGGIWNILDVFCGVIIITIYAFKILVWVEASTDANENAKFWAPSLPILYWAFHKSLSGILVLFLIFRLFKYLEFSNSLGMVGDTFAKAAKDLFFFTFIFVCIIVAYAYAAYYYFGSSLLDYMTIPRAIQSVFKLVLGQVEVDAFSRTSSDVSLGTFTTAYYWSVIVLVYFIMINMFLAIIVAAFDAIREDLHRYRLERLQGNKYVPPKITFLEWMRPLSDILTDRVKFTATWRSISCKADSACRGWRQSHFFPEQCYLSILESEGIIHRRRPPLIEHIVAYDAGRKEFLVKWSMTREEWATVPLLKQAEPKWLSKEETQDILDNPQLHPTHLRMATLLPGCVASDMSLLSWESRFMVTLRALRRSAREDIKRLTGLPDIYEDTYWTRGMANLITYSVNTSLDILLPRRIVPENQELRQVRESGAGSRRLGEVLFEQFEEQELQRLAMNVNKLSRAELHAILARHFQPCGNNFDATAEAETTRIMERYATNRNVLDFQASEGEIALLHNGDGEFQDELDEERVEISLKTVMKELRLLKELQRQTLESMPLSTVPEDDRPLLDKPPLALPPAAQDPMPPHSQPTQADTDIMLPSSIPALPHLNSRPASDSDSTSPSYYDPRVPSAGSGPTPGAAVNLPNLNPPIPPRVTSASSSSHASADPPLPHRVQLEPNNGYLFWHSPAEAPAPWEPAYLGRRASQDADGYRLRPLLGLGRDLQAPPTRVGGTHAIAY